jgi:hypothetical protein
MVPELSALMLHKQMRSGGGRGHADGFLGGGFGWLMNPDLHHSLRRPNKNLKLEFLLLPPLNLSISLLQFPFPFHFLQLLTALCLLLAVAAAIAAADGCK